jgi:alpha-amylase/alpha-mannosidase (GH57 family)
MLDVAFLWHMHQPYYKDLRTGEYRLPWVRLHAIKDYWGMAALAAERDETAVTFNLVPSLWVQIEDYAAGRAADPNLLVSRLPADGLGEEEVEFMRTHFFRCHRPTTIEPYPRYRELYLKLTPQACGPSRSARRPRPGELRDLQVWSTLAWFHQTLKESDPVVRGLVTKGRDFTEEDKLALFTRQDEILGDVLGAYRRLQDEGRSEISVSPFYHPILPLLCDMESAREAMPDVRLPTHRSALGGEAEAQLERARDAYVALFGRTPRGLWPSEGSVSEDILPLAARSGFRWLATDEEILHRSDAPAADRAATGPYSPYRLDGGGGTLTAFFRDRTLSDRISFTYGRFEPGAAVDDLVGRLLRIERTHRGRAPVAAIMLDGENPWENYPSGGVPFLRGLYDRIAKEPALRLTTLEGALAEREDPPRIRRLYAGSWINADFGIWVGSDEDNRAWDYLGRTLDRLAGTDEPLPEPARESLLVAEGSDWFWWYGDEYSSADDETFDLIFRRNLANAFLLAGHEPPAFLDQPIRSARRPAYTLPSGLLEIRLDGEATNYLEWCDAGRYRPGSDWTTMGRSTETLVSGLRFGASLDRLFLRVDTCTEAEELLTGETGLRLDIPSHAARLDLPSAGEPAVLRVGEEPPRKLEDLAVRRIVEIALAFRTMRARPGETLRFCLGILRDDRVVERHPRSGFIEMPVPSKDFERENWQV